MEEPSADAAPEAAPLDLDDASPAMASAPASSPSEKKKKLLTVKKATAKPKAKKQMLVARKVRSGEEIPRHQLANVSSPGKVRGVQRTAYGGVLGRTVLGSAERFEEYEAAAQHGDANSQDGSEDQSSVTGKGNASPGSRSAGGRSPTPQSGGHGETFDNLSANPKQYLNALRVATTKAYAEAEQTRLRATRHMEALHLHDRMGVNKEARVLKKWVDQQRDWQRLTSGLSRLSRKRPEEVLMLSSCEEYREQTEQYQALQAAVPQHVRHAEHYWEMSLRGHGQRLVRIGNIFSGLFCPLQKEIPVPSMIRRPKLPGSALAMPSNASGAPRKTWRDDPYMLARKRQWKSNLEAFLPHTVGEDETQGLLVVGKDLFGWAADGSQAVVDALETAHLTSPLEDLDGPLDPVGEDGALEESPRGVEGAEPPPEPRGDPYAAVLECVGTPHLHMAHAAGAGPSMNGLELRNAGGTVIYYEWRRRAGFATTSDETMSYAAPMARHSAVATANDVTFFCPAPSGSLLPGEAERVRFGFRSKVPGEFSEEWKLVVVPKAAVTGLPTQDGSPGIVLHGVATPKDDAKHLRDAVDARIAAKVGLRAASDVLYDDIVDKVATPRETLDAREVEAQRLAFEAKGSSRGLVYTAARRAALAALFAEAKVAAKEIGASVAAELGEPLPAEDAAEEAAEEAPRTPLDVARFAVRAAKLAALPDPEAWDGDVDKIAAIIDAIYVPPPPEPEVVEEPSKSTKATKDDEEDEEGEDDDEEEDDEEEDEEDDDEETAKTPAKPEIPKDPRAVRVEDLRQRWVGLVSAASTTADEDNNPRMAEPFFEASFSGLGEILAKAFVAAEEAAALEGALPPPKVVVTDAAEATDESPAVEAFDGWAAPMELAANVAGAITDGGDDLARDSGAAIGYAVAAVAAAGAQGPDAYRGAALATARRLLDDLFSPPGDRAALAAAGEAAAEARAAEDAAAADEPADGSPRPTTAGDDDDAEASPRAPPPPPRLPHPAHANVAARAAAAARLAAARPADCAGQVVLLQCDLDVGYALEYNPHAKAWSLEEAPEAPAKAARPPSMKLAEVHRSLRALGQAPLGDPPAAPTPPKAVVLLTDLNEPPQVVDDDDEPPKPRKPPSTALVAEALAAHPGVADGFDVTFVGDVVALEAALGAVADYDEAANSPVPVFVVEARNAGSRLCAPVDLPAAPNPGDGFGLPCWVDNDAKVAREAAETAFEQGDAGFRLKHLVDVVVHDALECLRPLPPATPRASDADAASLARLADAPRFLGRAAHLHRVALGDLLAPARPLVAMLGDERAPGVAPGLASRARLLDFLVDHCDEILLAGRVALECLAALGIGVGKVEPPIDAALLPGARALLAKAARRNVAVRLPSDFYTGDLLVNEFGVVGGGIEVEEDHDDEDNDAPADGAAPAEDEDVDASAGFDYDGDVSDANVLGAGAGRGVPPDVYALDVGSTTSEKFKDSIGRAKTVFWSGLLGAAECGAFQSGTREITEACVSAHDDREVNVILCGGATAKWAARFAGVEEHEFGRGDSVSHVADADGGTAFAHVLAGGPRPTPSGGPAPRLDALPSRDPDDVELLSDETLVKKQREINEREDEEDDEDGDDDGDY